LRRVAPWHAVAHLQPPGLGVAPRRAVPIAIRYVRQPELLDDQAGLQALDLRDPGAAVRSATNALAQSPGPLAGWTAMYQTRRGAGRDEDVNTISGGPLRPCEALAGFRRLIEPCAAVNAVITGW